MKSICFISGSSPEFLGGISLYQRNLINYAKKNKLDFNFTWIYPGVENKEYNLDGIKCIEIKSIKYPFLNEFMFSKKVKRILKEKVFDIINTHANWGYCLKDYKKKKNQKIVHTYHGVTYYFYKTHLDRFNLLKKIFIFPALFFSYIIEKPPIQKADKIICVSNRVKKEINELYKINKNLKVLRTGVDLSEFKKISKKSARKKLGLDEKLSYGLYIGRGGWFRKGLDRAIKISEEIYKLNKNYNLLVIGPDKEKVGHLIKKSFIKYIERGQREVLPYYYSSSDIFFCFSRYEGGAPILTLSEAMASECFVVCSKDSEQEIVKNNFNSIIIENFREKEAKDILETFNDKIKKSKIIEESLKTIKNLSLDKWGREYFGILSR